jgi:hypothetical protein
MLTWRSLRLRRKNFAALLRQRSSCDSDVMRSEHAVEEFRLLPHAQLG